MLDKFTCWDFPKFRMRAFKNLQVACLNPELLAGPTSLGSVCPPPGFALELESVVGAGVPGRPSRSCCPPAPGSTGPATGSPPAGGGPAWGHGRGPEGLLCPGPQDARQEPHSESQRLDKAGRVCPTGWGAW